jgi:hypothetical protein
MAVSGVPSPLPSAFATASLAVHRRTQARRVASSSGRRAGRARRPSARSGRAAAASGRLPRRRPRRRRGRWRGRRPPGRSCGRRCMPARRRPGPDGRRRRPGAPRRVAGPVRRRACRRRARPTTKAARARSDPICSAQPAAVPAGYSTAQFKSLRNRGDGRARPSRHPAPMTRTPGIEAPATSVRLFKSLRKHLAATRQAGQPLACAALFVDLEVVVHPCGQAFVADALLSGLPGRP